MFGYSHFAEFFVGFIQPLLPEFLNRFFIRLALYWAIWLLRRQDYPQKEIRFVNRIQKGEFGAKVAVKTDDANEQHYEVPTEFFVEHLSRHLKYSSSEWTSSTTLEDAELFTLNEYTKHLKLQECKAGANVLEVGNGWGSLSLFMAQQFPKLNFRCFSNSQTQVKHIKATAAQRGLTNLKPFCMDINVFCTQTGPGLDLAMLDQEDRERDGAKGKAEKGTVLFDRVVSIECLEHSRDYEQIFARISNILKDDGLMFVQILCHREYTYFMSNDSWMGRNFFTGGTIPSTKLFLHFNRDLVVQWTKVISGKEYSKCLDAWLHRLESKKDKVLAIFKDAYQGGKANKHNSAEMSASYLYEKWRMFYLMSSEAFAFNKGQEWMVAYYVFAKRR